MNHEIMIDGEVAFADTLPKHLTDVICATLEAEGVTSLCEIGVLLTDDAGIHEINLEQRGVDSPTDVLSFPMFELEAGTPPSGTEYQDPDTNLIALGDMVLNLDRATVQAEEFGHSVEREMSYLTVHSILHLLGYDHMDEDKKQMRTREEAILGSLGITR